MTPGLGFWVDPRSGLNILENRKIPLLFQKSNPDAPVYSLANILTATPRFSFNVGWKANIS